MVEIGDLVIRATDGKVLDVLRVIDRADDGVSYVCREWPFGTTEATYSADEIRPHPNMAGPYPSAG
jgi:hypothetical protein